MYSEASAAESTADFIHKMGMALKELRETSTCLKMFEVKGTSGDPACLRKLLDESRQLVAIFGASINTARKKLKST